MSHSLSSAYQHNELSSELDIQMILDYFLKNGCKVHNITLVKDFQYFLRKTEGQAQNRLLFKEYVDKLTEMKKEANGDKYLVLKEEYRSRRPKNSDTKMPYLGYRLSYQNSPPSVLNSNDSPTLPTKQRHPGPQMRVPSEQNLISPSMSKKATNYPSPILPQRSETFTTNSRTTTPTLGGGKARQELTSFMPAGLRDFRDIDSIHSSEPDRSSTDFSRSLEHAWVTACVTGNDEQIHRMLLEDSNFCHYQDYIYGYTGLHWAAKQGHIEIIASLLMAGADVNTRSFGGHSPLHLAAQQNREKVIEFFVNQCAADIDTRDNYGKPPSDYLPDFASKRSKYWLRKEHNTSVYSPLHYAQPKPEGRKLFGSQGELSTLERTASRIRVSFRRKSKTLGLQRANTVSAINS
ncbi:hypothetical protein LOD99_2961 [Oopsacas minuta]|uniref:SOWAHA-C winged helix-turn-helix domain-containing protein n=1 Tax=Oopsacas minuta TaxID=111878 RepID=A0AAV7K0J9_9METZ|nr:hypothetical protein LOD99_2961 [Oopsacas minuta]